MTKEKFEQAKATLASLEEKRRILEIIKNSGAIIIGSTHEVNATLSDTFTSHQPISYSLSGGMVLGFKSRFFGNSKIRELCILFHKELTSILETEVAAIQSEFETL